MLSTIRRNASADANDDANESLANFRRGRTTHPNGHAMALGFRPVSPPGFIALGPAQVVKVRHRNLREALTAGVLEERHGALHEAFGRRSRQGGVQRVGLGQERHIRRREGAGKTGLWRGSDWQEPRPVTRAAPDVSGVVVSSRWCVQDSATPPLYRSARDGGSAST